MAEYVTTVKELTALATSNSEKVLEIKIMSGLAKDIQTFFALAQLVTVNRAIANKLPQGRSASRSKRPSIQIGVKSIPPTSRRLTCSAARRAVAAQQATTVQPSMTRLQTCK